MSTESLTLDRFLGGRVIAAQPASGFRAGHDTVLLAAAVPAEAGSVSVELGSGAGVASLCLAARVPGARIVGIEIDPELVRLANENAARNGVADRVTFLTADAAGIVADESGGTILRPASPLRGGRTAGALQRVSGSGGGISLEETFLRSGSVDHVFFNPPFHPESAHVSPVAARDRATRDTSDAVRTWTGRALALVRDGGAITAIVRADRVDDILTVARGCGGTVFPLLPRAGAQPKRVIVRIVKSERVSLGSRSTVDLPSPLEGRGPISESGALAGPSGGAKRRKGGDAQGGTRFHTAVGLVLHKSDGQNTDAAEAVLRHASPLNLSP